MKVGAFELHDPVPDTTGCHAFVVLHPWIDAGSVGTMTLTWLESHFGARELGTLTRPGRFFDFTRYRPTMYFTEQGHRHVTIPNTVVKHAAREEGNDFLFLHVLEPHMQGEVYVDSVVRLLQQLGVARYCLLGGMYDMVPHTRPLIVTGGSQGSQAEEALQKADVQASSYEGPTTITYLITQRAWELGIETIGLIVHLPHYSQLEEDYTGKVRLMELLSLLYGLPVDEGDTEKAEEQRRELDVSMEKEESLKSVVAQLEGYYDARTRRPTNGASPQLPPDIERFLQDIDRRFRED